mmetsp:Transcript_4221/g.12912  ORF Transcript_4221/g.12912 Transcript_4221/m.12912 type:complete len:135 (-) Transcript_4221:23-427(-)
MSCSATKIAWPKCNRPVTFGGGIGIVNAVSSDPSSRGSKNPDASHHAYSDSSNALNSYRVGSSSDDAVGVAASVVVVVVVANRARHGQVPPLRRIRTARGNPSDNAAPRRAEYATDTSVAIDRTRRRPLVIPRG